MSVHIITRPTSKGVSHHVRWSRGRDLPAVLLGTHHDYTEPAKALRRAHIMRELALDDLARNLDPRSRHLALKTLTKRKVFATWAEEYFDSRTDLRESDGSDKGSLRTMRGHARLQLNPTFGRKDLRQITEADLQTFIDDMLEADYMPSTIVAMIKKTMRQVLRFGGISESDNVTLSKRVRYPKIVVEPILFSAGWVYPALRALLRSDELREAWDVLEHGGLRSGEIVNLTCGQLDPTHDRIVNVVSKGNPRRTVQRFAFEPDWIPKRPGAAPTDRVFPGLKKQTMAQALRTCSAKIGLEHMPVPGMPMTPQDLRQLCSSRLVNSMAQRGITWSDITLRDGHTLEVLHKHYVGTNPPPHETGPIAPAS